MRTSSQISSKTPQSPGKRLNRRERHRVETRERIIRSALRLFAERGLTGTTIEDITNAADIGKGTFFNYFPSKEHILAHLCQLQMGKIRDFVSRAIESKESLDRVLYNLALIVTEEVARNPALVQNILVPSLSSDSQRQQMANDMDEDRRILAGLMAVRQKRGEIRDDFTAIELALQFQRALFGTMVLWSLDPSQSLPDCLKQMSSVLWAGIRAQTPRSRQSS
jgi:AcrR family transcriptional regulator